jgi:hypothetical protein
MSPLGLGNWRPREVQKSMTSVRGSGISSFFWYTLRVVITPIEDFVSVERYVTAIFVDILPDLCHLRRIGELMQVLAAIACVATVFPCCFSVRVPVRPPLSDNGTVSLQVYPLQSRRQLRSLRYQSPSHTLGTRPEFLRLGVRQDTCVHRIYDILLAEQRCLERGCHHFASDLVTPGANKCRAKIS